MESPFDRLLSTMSEAIHFVVQPTCLRSLVTLLRNSSNRPADVMTWKCLPDFSIWGTNVPVEWLKRLCFSQTYREILEYLKEEESLQVEAQMFKSQLATIRFNPETRKSWLKIMTKLS